MAQELSKLAQQRNLKSLSYILNVAVLEAQFLAERRSPLMPELAQ
jgi:hypothetical protein